MPDDTTILGAGTFNAGMIGVGRRGTALLDFLQSRLNRESYVDVTKMRVGEQRWLDFIPSFMEDRLCILRDTGINAAYWNLHERPLAIVDGQIYAGTSPLRTYHFSGYDFERPEVLSRHAGGDLARIRLETQPIAAQLCAKYRAAVEGAGNSELAARAVDFELLPGGIPIDDALRAVYRASVLLAERQGSVLPADGYDLSEREEFVRWARWAYQAAGMSIPNWASGPSLDDVVRRLVETTSQAVAGIDARLAALENGLRAVSSERDATLVQAFRSM
jgi:hypothetical protein